MTKIKRFEDLEIWQRSRALCHDIFSEFISKVEITDFPLKDQINRSSGSETLLSHIGKYFK